MKKSQKKLNKKGQENFDKYLEEYKKHTDFHNKVLLKIRDEVYPRIKLLFLSHYYIEIVLLLNQTIELLVLKTIRSYQFIISGGLTLSKFDTILSIETTDETYSKSTLGNLIFELDKYCNDKSLIKDLKSYNSSIRNKFVHHLLDPKYSLASMNAEAEKVYKTASKLIDRLADLNQQILNEEEERKNRAKKIVIDYPEGVM
ncbi:MAG: hypothetical protein NUV49_00180 [Patescibacteria group bacterium]|nr:hypothetical protein [Patescibacteria group bacterium]